MSCLLRNPCENAPFRAVSVFGSWGGRSVAGWCLSSDAETRARRPRHRSPSAGGRKAPMRSLRGGMPRSFIRDAMRPTETRGTPRCRYTRGARKRRVAFCRPRGPQLPSPNLPDCFVPRGQAARSPSLDEFPRNDRRGPRLTALRSCGRQNTTPTVARISFWFWLLPPAMSIFRRR